MGELIPASDPRQVEPAGVTVPVPQTLNELQGYFANLYGRNNAVLLTNRDQRIDAIEGALYDLGKGLRGNLESEEMASLLARIPPRIFSLAEAVDHLRVDFGMMRKYPETGCVYCHHTPCNCNRIEKAIPEFGVPDLKGRQATWSLTDWQIHLWRIYGKGNEENRWDVQSHLFEEAIEVRMFELKIGRSLMNADKVEREYSLELADCLAWTIGSASLLKIPLGRAVLDRYWPVCPHCQTNPCTCSNFEFLRLTR